MIRSYNAKPAPRLGSPEVVRILEARITTQDIAIALIHPFSFHVDEVAVFARVDETHAALLSLKSCSIVSTAPGLE